MTSFPFSVPVFIPKFEQSDLIVQEPSKFIFIMPNSADPDQTAPREQYDQALHSLLR